LSEDTLRPQSFLKGIDLGVGANTPARRIH
jgi:hypothetical protein